MIVRTTFRALHALAAHAGLAIAHAERERADPPVEIRMLPVAPPPKRPTKAEKKAAKRARQRARRMAP